MRLLRRFESTVAGLALGGLVWFGSSGGALAGGAFAGGDGEAALTPRAIPKISGEEVKKSVDKLLSEIHWQTDLSHALATARDEGKPLFWLQLVGNLDDGL